ncbi:sulfate ABC transporter substrate-binding protein [Nocardioides sp. TRM66260-LWL]|uniref:sulfate ABC transporter substrate-binding protein n=1 Tax=Nocardioides sp. TRM66260-LWL TaxID=2874478 RepID=UPI001CC715E2|nr:sulfate ABC transporter substrate-binding protein [Nocardioides sp. TRM66260-LWL]MBZ5735649.1 sulfate ABC transporter substrate-binding protein [Nocardioides sp. TRM66260-LWL]
MTRTGARRGLTTRRGRALAAALGVGLLALTACGGGGSSSGTTLTLSAFSVMEAANEPVFADFEKTDAGKDVTFQPSYGASGDQSRQVVAGAKADVVHYSLESDVTRLVKAGLVAEDWKDTPTKGIATSSVVVLVVRKGNPKNIQGWDDVIKPGVQVITPNPGSSGSARWNILAAYAHGSKGNEDAAGGKSFVSALLKNTVALPGSGREATTAFTDGTGDVLLSYENEAILARKNGADVDYVVPQDTLLIQNPAAVTKDAPPAAKAFLEFLTGTQAQADYAQSGFRPVVDGVDVGEVQGANDPANPFPKPQTLYTIDDTFGGWSKAGDQFFGDGEDGNPLGIITQLQQATGKAGS